MSPSLESAAGPALTGSSPKILRTPAEVRDWRRTVTGSVGFVPTMGALHEGHAALLRAVRPRCDLSVLSIFVNPTQFGPKEDLAKYPRSFEKDLALAHECEVDVVFAPDRAAMYAPGFATWVDETSLTGELCGRFRPGHFRGVTTVVLKLFNLIQPRLALFGMKDAQQFFVLSKMARDLDLDVTVEGLATVREADGLALSSRNAYLSTADRERAPLLYATLTRAKGALETGADPAAALADAQASLTSAGFTPQYLECRRLPDFTLAAQPFDRESPYLIAVAAYLGTTRLIDNVILNAAELQKLGIKTQGLLNPRR